MKTLFKNKILILAVVVIVIGVGYYSLNVGSSSSVVSGGGVTKEAVGRGAGGATGSGSSAPGQIFASQLLAIQDVKINLDLFDDPVFINLQDFHKDIPKQPIYRENPFEPIDLETIKIVSKAAAASTTAASKTSTSTSKTKTKTSAGNTE